MKTSSLLVLGAILTITAQGCGSEGTPGASTLERKQDTRAAAGPWSQISQTRNCSLVYAEPCTGGFTLTIQKDGQFKIQEEGVTAAIAEGTLSPDQLTAMNQAVSELSGLSRSEGRECESAEEGMSETQKIQLTLNESEVRDVFDSGASTPELPQAVCFLGGKAQALQLKTMLTAIFETHFQTQ